MLWDRRRQGSFQLGGKVIVTKPCRSEEGQENKHFRQRAQPKPRPSTWKPKVVPFARTCEKEKYKTRLECLV